jgi:transposase
LNQQILTEVRARAAWMILEHEHAYANQSVALMAIAPKVGCGRDTLRRWVKQSDIDSGFK